MPTFGFGRRDAGRIAKTVQTVEAQRRPAPGTNQGLPQIPGGGGAWCRFSLDQALTTGQETVPATVQFSTNGVNGSVVLWNLPVAATTGFLFSGAIGAIGYAQYSGTTTPSEFSDRWYIWQLPCEVATP